MKTATSHNPLLTFITVSGKIFLKQQIEKRPPLTCPVLTNISTPNEQVTKNKGQDGPSLKNVISGLEGWLRV